MSARHFYAEDLIGYADALFAASGMPADRSHVVGELLVEADLLGHDTHGLQLAPRYLGHLSSGDILAVGDPELVSDRKAAIVWNGRGLSGVWLTASAVDLASARARDFGMAAVAIRNGRHTACLGAYLQRATAKGQMVLIASSTPSAAMAAPFGGLDPVFTPNPMAIGIPTEGDPILIDMSASITTNNMTNRLMKTGGRYPGKWVQDHDGNASDDPKVLFGDRRGSMLLAGGHDHGQKGYGLAVLVEALSQGLSGVGRASWEDELDTSIFVQVYEPEAFDGLAPFSREMSALAALCRGSRPAPGIEAVRLPGERALQKKRRQLKDGVEIDDTVMSNLAPWAERLAVPAPKPF